MDLDRLNDALAGRYRVERELGHGGMAVVYLARDLRHARVVAVKVLKPETTAALGSERFLREIAVTARLDHPHILPLLDSGDAGGILYYVMPFVDGESLRDRLKREKQLPLDDALAITREVADALDYAHGRGVVHRDIKPENILLAGGHARLGDFGIARVATALNATDADALTDTGMVVGTTLYMSPEQATGERALDRRTDVYSLAAVTYEMLAGEPPHAGATAQAVLTKKLREPVMSLRSVREAVPHAVDGAIRKALARVPADRFGTTRQFADALERGLSSGHRASDGPPASRADDASEAPTITVAASIPQAPRRLRPRHVVAGVLVVMLGGTLIWYLRGQSDSRWLTNEALPRIEKALDVADFEAAYAIAKQIEKRVPGSRELADLWPRIAWIVTIPSEPAGARVFRQPYDAKDETWEELGRTPLVDIHFPHGLSRIRFELDGYRPLTRALGGAHFNWARLDRGYPDDLLVGPERYVLDTAQSLPPDKVRVPAWNFEVAGQAFKLQEFLIGRYEVTNAEYKKFVDAGGYRRRELWDSVVVKGRTVPWEEAMRLFVDRTGRPGPSTWEAGDYREGQDGYPVSGVSWYEAAAFARFVGQELPTAHHWEEALANSMFPWLLPASNFGGPGPRAVTDSRAMSHVGAFDMTGNVREWTANAIGDQRIILGGSWNDAYYIAGLSDTSAPPADRSASNGFRLAVTHDEPGAMAQLRAPILSRATVSTAPEQPPVPDIVYAAYSRVFDYTHGPLNASIEGVNQTRVWTRERIRLDAGYGAERLLLYLYLPATGARPCQTVVYWPGWDAFALDDIDDYFAKQLDFVVKSGRAVAFPIYLGIFERRVGNVRRRPAFNTPEYRDNAIAGVKDLRRTLDYLETRPDIDARAFAFFGYSWGGVNGPLALAQESRFRAAVIDIGLLPPMSATPEVDPVNSLPRVHQPTLMLSGEFDAMVPAPNAERYFALIGTTSSDKRHVIAIGGHFIPRNLLIKEALDWFDGRLGPARR